MCFDALEKKCQNVWTQVHDVSSGGDVLNRQWHVINRVSFERFGFTTLSSETAYFFRVRAINEFNQGILKASFAVADPFYTYSKFTSTEMPYVHPVCETIISSGIDIPGCVCWSAPVASFTTFTT